MEHLTKRSDVILERSTTRFADRDPRPAPLPPVRRPLDGDEVRAGEHREMAIEIAVGEADRVPRVVNSVAPILLKNARIARR